MPIIVSPKRNYVTQFHVTSSSTPRIFTTLDRIRLWDKRSVCTRRGYVGIRGNQYLLLHLRLLKLQTTSREEKRRSLGAITSSFFVLHLSFWMLRVAQARIHLINQRRLHNKLSTSGLRQVHTRIFSHYCLEVESASTDLSGDNIAWSSMINKLK